MIKNPDFMKDWKPGDPMINEWDYWQDPDYVPDDPEKEALVLKLASMITDRYIKKFSKQINNCDPEYWALDRILTKRQVKFLLSFKKVRTPYFPEQLAEMNHMSLKNTKKLLKYLCWIGLVEMTRDEKPPHDKMYNVPIFVPGSAEFMMMNDRLTNKHPELATFFNLMTQLPLAGITQMVPPGRRRHRHARHPGGKGHQRMENKSVSVEHISHWLSKYDKYSVGQCTCRKQQTMRGEGSGEIEGEYCMGVGDMAEYCVDKGMGRYITYEEALEILERAERHGFVHQITNIDGEDKIVAICNCAPGVCNALRTSQLYNTPNMSASAYRAHVEKEKCVACGKCVEVCPVGAAKLGQKLCTKTGRDDVSDDGAPGQKGMGTGALELQLPRRCEDQLLRDRHVALQDGMSRASGDPGLYQDGLGGPLYGGAGADQAGQSLPGRLRRGLQPPLRGRLHPRHHRSAAGHR